MRPAERTALRELEHPLERDAVAEYPKALDHELDAAAAVLAEPAQTVLERRIRGIEEVAKDVHVAPLGLGVQLRRGDDADAERRARRDRLADARERVVIGERLHANAVRGGATHEISGLERAVRAQAVRVQVDGARADHAIPARFA
jgi:hypothetical protein